MTASDKLSSRNQPVAEPAVVVELGHGRWMIDRGFHEGHVAMFFEPAPAPGPFMRRAPHFAPLDMVQPGTVCIRFDKPEAMTFLRWWLALVQDPEGTPTDPLDFQLFQQPARSKTAAVANLAAGLAEPSRAAEVAQHYAALLAAMNGSVDVNGEQDALCALDAVAILLGQMMGGMGAEDRPGMMSYVTHRALDHAAYAEEVGAAARFEIDPDDIGQGGHA